MDGQRQDTQNGVSMERELTAGERFALQKEKAGGFKQLQTELKKTSWFVFTEEGEIQYKGITKPDMRKYKGSKSIEINNSECAFVDEQGKSIGQFIIEIDEFDVARVIPRPIEMPTLKSDRDFLYEIPESFDLDYDFDNKEYSFRLSVDIKQTFKLEDKEFDLEDDFQFIELLKYSDWYIKEIDKDISVAMNETLYQLIKNYPNWVLGRKEVDKQFKRYE